MPQDASYVLLPTSPSRSSYSPIEALEYADGPSSSSKVPPRTPALFGVSELTAWRVFLAACTAALALSAAHLTFLSVSAPLAL